MSNNMAETEQIVLKEEIIELDYQRLEQSKGSCIAETSSGDEIETESNVEYTATQDVGSYCLGEYKIDSEDESLEPTTFVNVSLACDEKPFASPAAVETTDGYAEEEFSPVMEVTQSNPADSKKLSTKYSMALIKSQNTEERSSNPWKSRPESGASEQQSAEVNGTVIQEQAQSKDSSSYKSSKILLKGSMKDIFYICNVCNKTFKRPQNLAMHSRSHIDLECNVCPFGGTQFSSKLSLLEHKRMKHPEREDKRKLHICETCGKPFPRKASLKRHQRSHTGEKPFKCDQCDKAYRYKSKLKEHNNKVHCGIKPEKKIFMCEICGKTYPYIGSLIRHRNSHTGENQFICDACGKSLSSKDHLKLHYRIHTGDKPNICKVCGKGFAKSQNLKQHVRLHTGERPFICAICSKAFTQRSALTVHSRYHTGQRPYRCDICDNEFVCRGLLTVHVRSHKTKSE